MLQLNIWFALRASRRLMGQEATDLEEPELQCVEGQQVFQQNYYFD
jgi:hypothetical protein